jgi:hypothetical protein
MTRAVITSALLAAPIAGFLLLRGDVATPIRQAIVNDVSDSASGRCGELQALVRRGYEATVRDDRSSLFVLVTGDVETAFEPRVLVTPAPPFHGSITEGRAKYEGRIQSYLHDLENECLSYAPGQKTPIYLAIRRAVEMVQADGDPLVKRQVVVRSDLEDTAYPEIMRALAQRPNTPIRGLPSPIENSSTDIRLCGFSATRGKTADQRRLTPLRTPERVDRFKEVWLSMFTNPSRVILEPFCHQSAG